MLERRVGTSHVGRHPGPRLVVADGFQQPVAHRATGKGPVGLQLQLDQDLAELLVELFAGDEQRPQPAAAGQWPVTGEENPILGTGKPDQLVVVQPRIIERIVTQDAQPLGQGAKHGVDDK